MIKKETLKHFVTWVAIIVTLQLLANMLIAYIATFVDAQSVAELEQIVKSLVQIIGSVWISLLAIAVVGPLLETWFYQYLLTRWIGRLTSSALWIVILASLCFGASHFYSPLYVIIMFFVGLLYNGAYVHLKQKYSEKLAFVCVFTSHALVNALVVLIHTSGWFS